MKQSWLKKSIIRSLLVLIFLIGGVIALQAGQSSYFYDELGRLVGVADGQGNMAVYNYDPVGNLLSIQKYTTSTSGIGIFLLMPSKGGIGSQVEIQGYGFDNVASNNQVNFNGTAATVISSSANSIITTVPPNATTGAVTVTNINGTAVSLNSFTVLQLPVITAISPNLVAQGSTNYNTIITGFNLTDATSVSFYQAGISATILSGGTSTQLPITLNLASNVPVASYPFFVTTTIGTSQSGTVTVTVKPPSSASSTALPISVFMPARAQVQPSGTETSSANAISVYFPPPFNPQPSGPESAATLPLSVYVPSPSVVTPSGPESAATLPISIYVSSLSTVTPSGSETAVAQPESVSMP